MNLLEAREVSVTPPGAPDPAVRGVSLEVGAGEWVAMTGPNGGGKSSLLLALSGLWPIQGEARLLGRSLAGGERLAREGIAFVFQDPSSQMLQPTVFDEIAFGPRNAGIAEAGLEPIVRGVASELCLEVPLEQDPSALSAGLQQVVLLAAALASGPRILFADEATAHLDSDRRRFVLKQIGCRVRAGLGVLWVTQLEDELARADRVVRLGESVAPPAGASRLEPRGGDEPLLWLEVAPSHAAGGPRIATSLSLRIPVGRTGVTALTGPNGVGKSVLLAAAAGLEHSEQVAPDWIESPQHPPIAAVQFPELQIFEERVADELAFAATSRGQDRDHTLDQARNLLQRMGLDRAIMERRTWALAAGEKRLVEIAATLLAPASLYVLDEPTAGLDPWRASRLAEVVRDVSTRSPILVATQDQDWARRVGAAIHCL